MPRPSLALAKRKLLISSLSLGKRWHDGQSWRYPHEVARRAEGVFPVEPVRTLDAIHLASALFLRESFPELLILSTDERVRRNALPYRFRPSALRIRVAVLSSGVHIKGLARAGGVR